MNRRDFFLWMAGASAAIGVGAEIDYDKLLWVPGAKTVFLPSETSIIVPDARTVDRVLAAHGVTMPRYHMTLRGREDAGTYLFDENWNLMSGREIGQNGQRTTLTPREADAITRKLGFDAPRGSRLTKQAFDARDRDFTVLSRGVGMVDLPIEHEFQNLKDSWPEPPEFYRGKRSGRIDIEG